MIRVLVSTDCRPVTEAILVFFILTSMHTFISLSYCMVSYSVWIILGLDASDPSFSILNASLNWIFTNLLWKDQNVILLEIKIYRWRQSIMLMPLFSDLLFTKTKKNPNPFLFASFLYSNFHYIILQFLQFHKYNNHCFSHVTWKHRYLLQYEYWGTLYLHSSYSDELSFQYKKDANKEPMVHVFYSCILSAGKNSTKVSIDHKLWMW